MTKRPRTPAEARAYLAEPAQIAIASFDDRKRASFLYVGPSFRELDRIAKLAAKDEQ